MQAYENEFAKAQIESFGEEKQRAFTRRNGRGFPRTHPEARASENKDSIAKSYTV